MQTWERKKELGDNIHSSAVLCKRGQEREAKKREKRPPGKTSLGLFVLSPRNGGGGDFPLKGKKDASASASFG